MIRNNGKSLRGYITATAPSYCFSIPYVDIVISQYHTIFQGRESVVPSGQNSLWSAVDKPTYYIRGDQHSQ